MSEVRVNNLSNENSTGGPTISGITTFSSTNYFVPPSGDTGSRPQSCAPGSLRFNTDTASLEYFRGNTVGWVQLEAEESSPIGARALFGGGSGNPATFPSIDYAQVATLGNALDFGDLLVAQDATGGAANHIRGIIAGGYTPSASVPSQAPAVGDSNVLQRVTIATTGNAVDHGDLTAARRNRDGCADSSRALFMSGYPTTAQIDAITIMTDGNSFDFGDTTDQRYNTGALSDGIRGVAAGGVSPDPVNIIDYVVIQSTGTAKEFGDLTDRTDDAGGHASSTRGIYVLGNGAPHTSAQNIINYITVASTGDATDFGDFHGGDESGCTGSATRALIAGGYGPASPFARINNISYIEIATLGNSVDFGDLTGAQASQAAFSNSGGGK